MTLTDQIKALKLSKQFSSSKLYYAHVEQPKDDILGEAFVMAFVREFYAVRPKPDTTAVHAARALM